MSFSTPIKRDRSHSLSPLPKRRKLSPSRRKGKDLLSHLSDEILLRILSFLSPPYLLALAPVSHRFYTLTSDSHLWKALYYNNFVLPRALRIPGFRDGGFARGFIGEEGGVIMDWKKHYKVRHKWAGGKCEAWSFELGEEEDGIGKGRALIRVCGTTVVTADGGKGLCAWDSSEKRGSLLARVGLGEGTVPSCISVEQVGRDKNVSDVALGFEDGGFGIWRLFIREKVLVSRYRHEKSSNGELVEMAYAHPYLLTATTSVLVSLYTFDVPNTSGEEEVKGSGLVSEYLDSDGEDIEEDCGKGVLQAPYLLTSLNSHTPRPPLALSIRKTALAAIASIAYTCSTLQGWAIGVQDLHIRQPARSRKALPEVTTTRIAYTTPMPSSGASYRRLTPPPTPRRQECPSGEDFSRLTEPGPTCLRYTHPYLLATLPDNTLVLYMCTSNASSLSISPGIRLWGHTSGISDAQITRRGKVVSVSSRGGEMRAWELEGCTRYGSRRSVEIRPKKIPAEGSSGDSPTGDVVEIEQWRKSVGFTDEMLIVLNEGNYRGRATMMVYDFR
ncbi:F-box only protein 15 [Podospora fimiseda]|uniref:F-box only protein 15 n=1 Tax=Podospora fimiseda TaxID=252190 RepID=A0AAN7GUZ0_9PEZI|nr:F-box only protein 15 [Podospora fimiseda]